MAIMSVILTKPQILEKFLLKTQNFMKNWKKVAQEIYRILKPGKVMGWLIGDQWVKRKFTPVGFKVYQMLVNNVKFKPIELICVTRRNQSSNTHILALSGTKI